MRCWRVVSGGLAAVGFAAILAAGTPQFDRALDLYHRTESHQSLAVLEAIPNRDAAAWKLIGQDHFMLGEYKKATEALEKAVALAIGEVTGSERPLAAR